MVRKIDHMRSTCVLVGLKDVQRFSLHLLLVSFGHYRHLAASQVLLLWLEGKTWKNPTNLHNPRSHSCACFGVSLTHQKHAVLQGRSNCVAYWQVSFGMLWTVSQASLTDFTTYLPVKVPVKLTNLTICSRWKSSIRLLHKSTGLNVLTKNRRNWQVNFMIQASKSQKRDFRHFSGANMCYSHGNVRFENFMYMQWSEEKFLKGIVGDKRRLRFWNKHKKIELLFTQLARYNRMHGRVLKNQKIIPDNLANT